MVAYAYVSFSFFSERIYCEEFMLLKFFGKEYREYQVPIKKKVMDLKLATLGQSELWHPWHPGLQGPGLG